MNRPLVLSVLCLIFLDASLTALRGNETNGLSKTLRPFYIIGHGANSLKEAGAYLDSGANALEMDVNIAAGNSSVLCIGHGPELGTGVAEKDSLPLPDFLDGLHELARKHTNFCLVYFDCKSLAATPERGVALLEAIRTHLIGSGDDQMALTALISIGKLRDKSLFLNIANRLGPREGLMVDGVSNPAKVSKFFTDSKVVHQAYCDGIVPLHPFFCHFLVYGAVKKGCQLRDQKHDIRFVGTWSVNNPWLMIKYIRMGVDGIVTDRRFHWYNFCWVNLGRGLGSLSHIVHRKGNNLNIRLANRADNPFSTDK